MSSLLAYSEIQNCATGSLNFQSRIIKAKPTFLGHRSILFSSLFKFIIALGLEPLQAGVGREFVISRTEFEQMFFV